MHSALYTGFVRHRRTRPIVHGFSYRLTMTWLDLAELGVAFRGRWLWSTRGRNVSCFRRKDYLGDPRLPLDRAVREEVEAATGRRPTGPVRMLTHLRTFGLLFNPVTFYYVFDAEGARVDTIVAEITNTPWNERHACVLPRSRSVGDGTALRFQFTKSFHVSPFLPMDLEYDWRFTEPGQTLVVHMEDHDRDGALFDATLSLRRVEITTASLARALSAFPATPLKVVGGIYGNALRLWWKGAPFHPHPRKAARAAGGQGP